MTEEEIARANKEYAKKVVAKAPPLTPEQGARIREILLNSIRTQAGR